MKSYKAIFFDFDGTLADSSVGVTKGVAYTLERYKITPPPLSELTCFIGPPLSESFEKYYGFARERGLELEYVFREYYDEKGLYEAHLYEDVVEMLGALKSRGKIIAIASSKPEKHVIPLLKHLGIYEYFDFIGAADIENGLIEKEDIVKRTVLKMGLSPSECLMVGDRCYDIVGAHKNGMECMAVLWGFGSREEFEEFGADFVAESPKELEKMLS